MKALLFVLLLATGPAAVPPQGTAQVRVPKLWYEAYLDGVAAIRASQWDRAVILLEASLKLNPPKQGQRVRFQASSVRPFIPDYYLGVAYLNLRNYAAADDAFGRVLASKIVGSGDPEYKDFVSQSQEAKFERVIGDATSAFAAGDLNRASTFASQASALPGATGAARARTSDLVDRIDRARAALSAGTQAPPKAGAPGPVSPPNPNATTTSPQPGSQPAAPPPAIPGTSTPPVVAPGSITPLATPPGTIPPTTPTNAAATPPAPRTPPGVARRPPPLVVPIAPAGPDAETQAIVAFFSGDYRQAAGMLRGLTGVPTASPRARFYYACSLAALVFVGEAGAGEATLSEARAEMKHVGDLARFERDRRLISPRILHALETR